MSRPTQTSPTTWLALALGLAVGALMMSLQRGPVILAAGNDRSGESILGAGPVEVGYHQGLKIEITTDAIYFLDWRAGKLIAALPTLKQSGTTTKVLGPVAERDLIADFHIEPGKAPHFLMTTGNLGIYDGSGSRLFVLESTTRQLAVYSVQRQNQSGNGAPKFELLEKTTLGKGAEAGL